MGTIRPFKEGQPFDHQTCEVMGLAFDTAWQKLLVSGTHLVSPAFAETTRKTLAMHILDLAKAGELDVNRLRDGAVAFVLSFDAKRAATDPSPLRPHA
jgi:hypothetical protein